MNKHLCISHLGRVRLRQLRLQISKATLYYDLRQLSSITKITRRNEQFCLYSKNGVKRFFKIEAVLVILKSIVEKSKFENFFF